MKKYQVCFDIDFVIGEQNYHKTKVCYESDSKFDAECYIDEMFAIGDYSNYYIKIIEN